MTDIHFLFDGPETAPWTLALAHGAGAAMDSPFLETIARGLGAAGVRLARFEFPYMHERRSGGRRRAPDPPAVLRASWLQAIRQLSAGAPRLAIGGKSLGGRIASMVADEARVGGLVCLGYPFHPPGRPDRLRTEHLRSLQTPALFVQGTRDPFGGPDEVATYSLSPAIRMAWIEDGDHSLKPRARSGRTEAQNLAQVVSAVAEFLANRESQERRISDMAEKIEKTDAEWRAALTPEQYRVLREKGTERPFSGEYARSHDPGTYVCAGCGNPLFSSDAKFESGTGWPSFWRPISGESVNEKPDNSLFMRRTEVLCQRCGGHLGHVFDDGPKPTGLRYCMNSVAMKLDKTGAGNRESEIGNHEEKKP